MLPTGIGRSTGEDGGDSGVKGEDDGDLSIKFMGLLGRGGLIATGGFDSFVFEGVMGGLMSRICSSSITSEEPSGLSSSSERLTERSRILRKSVVVTIGRDD